MAWNDAILPSAESVLSIGWDDLTPEQQAAIIEASEGH